MCPIQKLQHTGVHNVHGKRDGIVINETKAYYLISNVQSKIQRRTFIHSMIMKLHSLLLVQIHVPTSTPLR